MNANLEVHYETLIHRSVVISLSLLDFTHAGSQGTNHSSNEKAGPFGYDVSREVTLSGTVQRHVPRCRG